MMRRVPLLMLVIALLASGVMAQDGRHGVIIEANYGSASGFYDDVFLPFNCASAFCKQVYALTLPTLFSTDPATGALIGAQPDNRALVADWSLETGIMHLRDDLQWSDGTPITAYDVLYTFLVILYRQSNHAGNEWLPLADDIGGIRLIDDYNLAFDLISPTCSLESWVNQPIGAIETVPFFRAWVDSFNTPDTFRSVQEWVDGIAAMPTPSPQETTVTPVPLTGGLFELYPVRPGEGVRFLSDDLAYETIEVPSWTNPVEMFLNGTTNLLINPPYNRRDDVRAAANIQISEYPGAAWDMLLFNVADPAHPLDAFDADGNPRVQGVHPLFGDVRVRRAIQLALNLDEISEVVFQGNATPLPANLPPTSWAYNADLAPTGFDRVAAERLLDEAGWRDTNGDGLRECYTCLYAEPFTPMNFSMLVDSGDQDRYAVADLITRQLRQVGIAVDYYDGSPENQTFDAYLTGFAANDPRNLDPDQAFLFSQAADRVNRPGNVGSYYNPRVEELLAAANSVPGCALGERAALYHELQTIMQQDQPAAWLYTRNDFIAARGIEHFAPYPNNPFWNISEWVVRP